MTAATIRLSRIRDLIKFHNTKELAHVFKQTVDEQNESVFGALFQEYPRHSAILGCLSQLFTDGHLYVVEYLKAKGFVSDSVLLSLSKSNLDAWYDPSEADRDPYLAIIQKYGSDGSAKIAAKESEFIFYLACDYFLPYLQRLEEVGVVVDYDYFLVYSCCENVGESMLQYLLQNVDYSQEVLMEAIILLLFNTDYLDDEAVLELIRCFHQAGLDFNKRFDEEDADRSLSSVNFDQTEQQYFLLAVLRNRFSLFQQVVALGAKTDVLMDEKIVWWDLDSELMENIKLLHQAGIAMPLAAIRGQILADIAESEEEGSYMDPLYDQQKLTQFDELFHHLTSSPKSSTGGM